jgi:hypothetical protein
MRFLVKVSMPVEAGNAASKAGKLGATIQSILADLKPRPFTSQTIMVNGRHLFSWKCRTLRKSRRLPSRGSWRSMRALRFIR